MKAAVLFSGGKDSNLALHKAKEFEYKIKYLITLLPIDRDSWMWHWPNAKWTTLQAKALGIEQLSRETKIGEEAEIESLEFILSELRGKVDTIVTGAIASRYQADRIEGLCKRLGFDMFSPLWGLPPEQTWTELLDLGFDIIIISVSAEGLGKEWLGRRIDKKALDELTQLSKKYKFHLGGEGGEFETFVLNGPGFKKRIEILKAKIIWEQKNGQYLITEAKLI
jgi:ABC transporter with metal-binding/Fe-S-binding domain ATP-binding protein